MARPPETLFNLQRDLHQSFILELPPNELHVAGSALNGIRII